MSFFGKLKDVTGIGLSPDEQYRRAYEKGVFLQPPDYDNAVKWFTESAENYTKGGNAQRARHATANAALYSLIAKKVRQQIAATIEALRSESEIERPGSQTEMLEVNQVIAELSGLQLEHEAEQIEDTATKTQKFKQAADLYMPMGTRELLFAEKLQFTGPTDTFMKRAYYCLAAADANSAQTVVTEYPDQALDFWQRSVSLYRQAQQPASEQHLTAVIAKVQKKRHCWMCQREMQGEGLFYEYFPAHTCPYHRHLVENAKEDVGMIDRADAITLCTVCGSAVQMQADAYARRRSDEVRQWADSIFQQHARAIAALEEEIKTLKRS